VWSKSSAEARCTGAAVHWIAVQKLGSGVDLGGVKVDQNVEPVLKTKQADGLVALVGAPPPPARLDAVVVQDPPLLVLVDAEVEQGRAHGGGEKNYGPRTPPLCNLSHDHVIGKLNILEVVH